LGCIGRGDDTFEQITLCATETTIEALFEGDDELLA